MPELTDVGFVTADSGVLLQAYNVNILTLKNNLSAAVDPTADEDSGDGYAVGSRWVNTTDDKEFVCLDAIATAAVWTETTGGGGDPTLLIEHEVTVAKATDIEFTSAIIDINTHKSYRYEIEMMNGSNVSQTGVRLFINNDTTAANYDMIASTFADSSVFTSGFFNTNAICQVTANDITMGHGHIMLVDDHAQFNGQYGFGTTSNQIQGAAQCSHTGSNTNITQLNFVATNADGFDIGTKIRIYRGDT